MQAVSISTLIIEGVIDPTRGMKFPCGKENAPPSPHLNRVVDVRPLVEIEDVRDRFEEIKMEDEYFWKQRVIVYVSAARSIVSASFLPVTTSESRVLFVQNRDGDPIGFVAPFLSQAQKKSYKAHEQYDKYDEVSSEEDLAKLLEGLADELKQELLTCLEFFMQDETTSALGLTYQDPAGHYITHGWVKSSR